MLTVANSASARRGARAVPPRIAFKLVWAPGDDFRRFVLVDDDGALLAAGAPSGQLPALEERKANYEMVAGSKYGSAAARL